MRQLLTTAHPADQPTGAQDRRTAGPQEEETKMPTILKHTPEAAAEVR
jgi:hypothetical protein